MDFRLLGPLEVESGGSFVRIAGAKERAVLVLLLLYANRLVSRDRLVDELWGDSPPATARHTLEAYVSRLRRSLSTGGAGAQIESQPGGYRIRLGEDELDLLRFERLLEEGRSALARGAPAEAEEKLAAALGLWRGEVVAELADEPFVAGEVERLDELRLTAVEAHSEASLALGRHAELVGELRSLVARYPLREGLRGQLMLALYRAGRQADALAVYLEGRRLLVEDLGIEPGRDLQDLQQAILRHDPSLDRPAVTTGMTSPMAAKPGTAATPELAQERRKVVTVLVCEPSESTALADRIDPEALEALLARYFESMKAIVERHGGTVTRSLSATVLAVFGVPLLHEDDALRACLAAIEMHGALPELSIDGRIGIATGEVIAGPDERLATGAAVQLAAELAKAAALHEILLGAETVRLLGPLVASERVTPLAVSGKAEPVPAFRFLRLTPTAERGLTPFMDRDRELALLIEAFERAMDERELHLVTLLGPAGIGKSRLAREFLDSLPFKAQVVRGRCLSYGQAITYWPLAEVLRALGEPARLALERVVSGGASSPQELAWTVQRALEQQAADGPLVVVVEDLHWAEPALLDLLDSICERSRGYPIVLLCVARTELLEHRASWAGGKLNAATVLLEPLADKACQQLVDALERPLDADQRRRVIRVAAGNPLFLEELTEFVADRGDGDLPPRIHALLQARLDGLPELERIVLSCAAVEGTVFHTGGLRTLVPEGAELGIPLAALSRKLLIWPVPGELEGEEAFRFRHQLIRDTAYAAIPKADRARLHERFAGWLEQHTGDRGELAELSAYHLEQAALARRELGAPDAALDARAATQLAAAGERAGRRTDLRAAVSLWRRSLALLDPEDPQVPMLEVELAEMLTRLGRLDEAGGLLERADRGTSDPAVAAAIRVARLRAQLFSAPEGPAAIRAACADAIPLFEQRGDYQAVARVWHALATAERAELQMEAAAQAYANAAERAHRAGDLVFEAYELGLRVTMLGESRLPYAVAARELEPIAVRFPGEPFFEACLIGLRGLAAFHDGRRKRGRTLMRAAIDGYRGAGYTPVAVGSTVRAARAELVTGDIDEAERLTLTAIDEQRPMDLGFLGHAKAVLSEIRIAQGRFRDALQLADGVEGTGGPDGRLALVIANSARARAHARLGEIDQAQSAADEAVAVASAAESFDAQARAQCALAEVLNAADKLPAALAAAEEAGRLYSILERTLERRQVAALAAQIKRRITTDAPMRPT